MNLEVEAKFQIDDLAAVKQRLLALGGTITKGRLYEKNTVYDDAAQSLKNGRKLIRLRQDEKVRLTFKGPAPADLVSEAKVREEIELEVADFNKMEQIIGRMGYEPAIVYEKYRETIVVGDVEAVLDELPYGNFVELEGAEQDIKQVAAAAGMNWETRIDNNYLGLLYLVKQQYGFEFRDLTFENFADVAIHWDEVL